MNGKVWNFRDPNLPPDAIYIGRPVARLGLKSTFGNPYVIGPDGDRQDVIKKYEHYIKQAVKDPAWREAVAALAGKDLYCYCAPLPCHGDILLKLANELQVEDESGTSSVGRDNYD